ncbi:acyl carrier protein [Chryseobacterium joostei]|uniref:Acyl carrier protein n=1 Tax=Chryseobacterium joostei TaxID=112234 RepID=A0A1N7I3Q5_9FLAO|nr:MULTISPECIES: phosphopantetheine-binding protein [Chryseobacterium]AZA99824.1 acyl carrier protein [Chryseobacterium joostei]SIS31699.1 acyl carrier protein [Chryseobacterium joostei]HCM33525.1 acyl carrier protein [Chryseobacterium sp.]
MEDFLEQIAEIMEVDSVNPSDELNSFEAWDSLTMLSIIALADDEYKVSLTNSEIADAKTIDGLSNLILSKQNA